MRLGALCLGLTLRTIVQSASPSRVVKAFTEQPKEQKSQSAQHEKDSSCTGANVLFKRRAFLNDNLGQ